jgi:hypothetical protein
MVAIQSSGVNWVHQDPVTKSQRVTNSSGTVTSTIDLDPWGGETSTSSNQAFQPHRYTSYERDVNGSDDAMMRRYHGYWNHFDQPDPYDGSYDFADPQSSIHLQATHVAAHGLAERFQVIAALHGGHYSASAGFCGPLRHDVCHLHEVFISQ